MESSQQHTLANPISCSGIGIHTGNTVSFALLPAEPDSGIVFRRTDVKGCNNEIYALYDMVQDTTLGTKIANEDDVTVSTIEHLMAALWGAGVDNAIVELDGAEVPIMDGSSEPFTFLIECAGIKPQNARRKYIKILKDVSVDENGGGYAKLSPATGMQVSVGIDFSGTPIGQQDVTVNFDRVGFKSSVSRARTFGFEHEVEYLRSRGLALGGSLDNAIVVGRDGILNRDGLRYTDEFARHKVLDCVGDLFLAGYRIEGKFTGFKSGHGLNNRILHALFADDSAWKLVSCDDDYANSIPAHSTYNPPELHIAAA